MTDRVITSTTADATRAELTRRLDSLQGSTQGSGSQRRERDAEIAALRLRLQAGDFEVGDRFLLDDGTKRDTVIVRDSSHISLLNWPSYSLHGVLRSELQPAIERYVGTYVREPRIRTFPLVRLSFSGGFGRPGYFSIDPTRPFSDAINIAGGTGPGTKSEKITVHRDGDEVMDEKRVAAALRDGATLDDLGLQDGDEVRAPAAKTNGYRMPPLQMAIFGISALGAILALIRSSYVP